MTRVFRREMKAEGLADLVRGMLEVQSSRRFDCCAVMNLLERLEAQAVENSKTEQSPADFAMFQQPPEINVPPATLKLKKPNSRRNSIHEDEQKLELMFSDEINAIACRRILRDIEIDFKKEGIIDPDYLNACYFTATVMTNFKLFGPSDELLKHCQAIAATKQDHGSLQFYIRICFMRINNLKILNNKTEALQIASGLSYFMYENKSAFPSMIAELSVIISNLFYLTNDLGQSFEQLNVASSVIAKTEWDEAADNKTTMINLMMARIQVTLGNFEQAKEIIDKCEAKGGPSRSDFVLLKAECHIEMNKFDHAESILYKLARTLDENRKADADTFLKIELLLFLIAMAKNDAKALARGKTRCQKFIEQIGQQTPLQNLMLTAMMGVCKLDIDSEAASELLRQAAVHIDEVPPEHLSMKLSVFKILLHLMHQCPFHQVHMRFLQQVLQNIEFQCAPGHFCTLAPVAMKCMILWKSDQFEEAKRISLVMRDICRTLEDRILNWEVFFDIWSQFPRLLYDQGFLAAAKDQFAEAQRYINSLARGRMINKVPSLGNIDPHNVYSYFCRVWILKIDAEIDPSEENMKELKAIIADLKPSPIDNYEKIHFEAYKAYFKNKFNLSRRRQPKDSQPKNEQDTTINELIRLVNKTENVHIKLEGIFIVAEFLALNDLFKDCETYIEKAYFLIDNDPKLASRKHELGLKYRSKAFRIFAQYNILVNEDDLETASRASKLLKALYAELASRKAKNCNGLHYAKARYRVCLALMELRERVRSEKEFIVLFREILSLRYRVGFVQYHCRLELMKFKVDCSIFNLTSRQMAEELMQEAIEIFGKGSDQAKLAAAMFHSAMADK